jgi:Mg-chelatase subunit ChlD
MSRDTHYYVYVIVSLFLVLLFGRVGASSRAAAEQKSARAIPLQASQANLTAPAAVSFARLAAPNACPPAPAGFPDVVEYTNFCVYYNDDDDDGDTTPDPSAAEVALVADYVQDYWDRYQLDFGFLPPLVTGIKLEVQIQDSPSCNGSAWDNYINVWTGCFSTDEEMQHTVGHEVFHRVQFNYDPDWDPNWSDIAWLYEGTARAMEDNVFNNIDNWAGAMTAAFSFNQEVNNYLVSSSSDITSFGMRYMSAMWWKYFSEQYGADPDEPELGVDAWLELWQAAAAADGVAAVNTALSALGAGTDFNTAFRRFTVANWTKDLSGLPDDSYNYVDEEQVGNPAVYGPLVPQPEVGDDGIINIGDSAVWNNQSVGRYGARYYAAEPGPDCPVISATFHRDLGANAFYHVVTQDGNTFADHVEGSGADWTQSFLNNGITQIVAIIGGQANSAQVDVTLSCADPVVDIELPNELAPAYVGPFDGPDDIVIQVAVTNGSATGPVVGGLTNSDFQVEVGGTLATVLGGGFVQEEYFLLVDTPTQGANGPYDLEVFLEEPGTATVIASDIEMDAVIYDATNTDHVIITDVSGSMGWDGKMEAARNTANLFVDASNSTDGLGLVSFSSDVVDTLGIQFGTLPHRNTAHTQVNSYLPTFATSIGDGLDEAVAQRAASPTGNARCQFTLLSDGMENQPLYWADVQAAVVATGCPVMTVAFGAASNELLMEDIATATGGVAYYNDVFTSAIASASPDDTELDLGDTYMYALCEGQGCERLLSVRGSLGYAEAMTHTLTVDDSVSELEVVLDWQPYYQIPLSAQGMGSNFLLSLMSPSGTIYDPSQYAFADALSGYAGFRIANPEAGEWQVQVISFFDDNDKPYQVLAFGQTSLAVKLLLPATEAATGDTMPIYAIWRPGGDVLATITPMNGISTTLSLHDDGQHGDGAAGDGFFAGLYTLVNQAQEVAPVDEGVASPAPADEGAYGVHLLATDGDLRRETQGAFAVPAGADDNGDTIPDDFIATHCPGAPNSDADLDQLSCADEYFTGTDPNNSDSDGGGENDGSEVLQFGLDPLDPADDQIAAPDFLQTTPQNGAVRVTYDVKDEYTTLRLYRATSPNGPWSLRVNELPLDGAYMDGATNDTTYYYRLLALDAQGHGSAIPTSTEVTPSTDPVPPEARVLIDGGAATTKELDVSLSFVPYHEHEEGADNSFDDITEMLISNDPFFAGAQWQPFAQDVAWQLAPTTPGDLARVYARFRDDAGNESVGTTVGMILYAPYSVYVPIVIK